ncbi:MAG TPA: redoxin domain-containing protein [Chloroflexi bacterium]|nr:redoxin domain-containing protein [Chloroflexota bacterium]
MPDDEITPLPPGSPAPDFTLRDVFSGEAVTLGEALSEGPVVLNFWSGECEWSRNYDDYFNRRAAEWAEKGIRLLHIASNATESPDDIRRRAGELKINAPVLRDEGNAVADAYGALTTPHVFLIAPEGRIVYQGAVDDRSFRQRTPTVNYLDAAVEALLAGRAPDVAASPPYGCTIVRAFEE